MWQDYICHAPAYGLRTTRRNSKVNFHNVHVYDLISVPITAKHSNFFQKLIHSIPQ